MVFRSFVLLTLGLTGALIAQAQGSSITPPGSRSHVERFTTQTERAEQAETVANARLATNQADANAFNLRGVARLRLGRYAESYEDLWRAVELRPDNSEYQANLGYVLWKLGKSDEAISATRASLKLNDKNFAAYFQLGRFLLRLGGEARFREAIVNLRQALELDPRQYDVRFELIGAYRALGSSADASAQLDFLWDSMPSDARVFYVSALLATDRGDFAGSIKDFNEAVRRDATMVDAWRDLGLSLIKLKRWSDAVEAFAELVRRQSDSVEAAYVHALALYNSGKPSDAEAEVRRALRINGGASEAHTLLGIILAARGNANAEAADVLSQAVALDRDNFDANFYLGRVQYALKNFTEASKSLRTATRLQPGHPEARFFLGTALEAGGESDAAMVEYQALVNGDRASAMGQLGLGALLVKQGKIEEAIGALRKAIVLDRSNFEAHWALGRALVLAQRFEEATESLRSAVLLSPNRSDAHYQLGLALKRLGRTDEANREFAIVDRLNSEFRSNSFPK
jgi:tetratricopeptide (TPR) repeat protein